MKVRSSIEHTYVGSEEPTFTGIKKVLYIQSAQDFTKLAISIPTAEPVVIIRFFWWHSAYFVEQITNQIGSGNFSGNDPAFLPSWPSFKRPFVKVGLVYSPNSSSQATCPTT